MQDIEARAEGQMPSIDLTLAINYLPAVEVVMKVAAVSSCLALVGSEMLGMLSIMALLLSVDRSLGNTFILDGNALQYSVLLSWFVNHLRASAHAPPLVLPMASVLWWLTGYMLVVEPRPVQEFFVLYGVGTGGRMRQLLPALTNNLFVALFTFLPCAEESGGSRVMRSLVYTLLCVLWVYMVTVWRTAPLQPSGGMCVFTCHALIARFSPVLYLHWTMACGYALASIAAMLYHYVALHVAPPTEVSPPREAHKISTIAEEEDEDLEAYFQSAKLQQLKGGE
jgi:hypothetical protein